MASVVGSGGVVEVGTKSPPLPPWTDDVRALKNHDRLYLYLYFYYLPIPLQLPGSLFQSAETESGCLDVHPHGVSTLSVFLSL